MMQAKFPSVPGASRTKGLGIRYCGAAMYGRFIVVERPGSMTVHGMDTSSFSIQIEAEENILRPLSIASEVTFLTPPRPAPEADFVCVSGTMPLLSPVTKIGELETLAFSVPATIVTGVPANVSTVTLMAPLYAVADEECLFIRVQTTFLPSACRVRAGIVTVATEDVNDPAHKASNNVTEVAETCGSHSMLNKCHDRPSTSGLRIGMPTVPNVLPLTEVWFRTAPPVLSSTPLVNNFVGAI